MAERARGTPKGEGAAPEAMAEGSLGAIAADAVERVESHVKSGQIGGAAAEARQVAGDIKSAAVDQGKALLSTAKQQATSFADQRKNDAARSVSDFASSLRQTGDSFDDRPNIQAFIGGAAEGLDQLASGLRERSFADIYGDVEEYARRSPATVGAVAVVAGFLLARFIKSSADELSEAGANARASARRHTSARADA